MTKIALVTGASRGAGRGIARVLGRDGWTVYVTGRSRPESRTENLPGSVDETAAEVTREGGRGVAMPCDHTDDAQVEALFAALPRLDLLVNNVWGGYERHPGPKAFAAPFWEQPLSGWEGMFGAGLRAHFTASRLAARAMLAERKGLILCTTAWDRDRYLGNLLYDVAKCAVQRLVAGMARELRPHGVAAVAVAPGFMRTERVEQAFQRDAPEVDYRAFTESVDYLGRAVAALAADPQVMQKSGQVVAVGDLAAEYGFTDVDGRLIPVFRLPDEEVS